VSKSKARAPSSSPSDPEERLRSLLRLAIRSNHPDPDAVVEAEVFDRTPERVLRAWIEMTAGYRDDPAEILSRRFNGGRYDELVVVNGIRFSSLCEHHLLPFTGTATVAYLPGAHVVGLSKLPRLVLCYARRLQMQERLTRQVADALMFHVKPKAVGVVVRAHHSCMGCRGVLQPDAVMVTSAMLGKCRTNRALRAEVLALAQE